MASLANGRGQRDRPQQGHHHRQAEEMQPLNGGQNNVEAEVKRDPSSEPETMLTTCIVEQDKGTEESVKHLKHFSSPLSHFYAVHCVRKFTKLVSPDTQTMPTLRRP